MFNFYVIMVGLVLGGIGFVIFLLANDKSSPDQLEQISITDILSDKNIEIDLSEPLPGKEDKSSVKENPPEKQGQSFFAKFFKKAKPSSAAGYDSAAVAFEEITAWPRKSIFQKLPIAKLADKIPFLKRKQAEDSLSSEEYNELMTRTLRAQLGLQENKRLDKETPKPSGEGKTSSPGTANFKIAPKEASDSDLPPKISTPAPKLTPAENAALDQGIESSVAYAELQQKHSRIEKILKERTDELERSQHDLQNETSNRKEFNKVKDLLEKELADTREKTRQTNNALRAAQAESGVLQKRIQQMEDKISQLEKGLLAKEQEIEDILRKKTPHPPANQPKDNNIEEKDAPPATANPPSAATPSTPDKARRALEEALKDPCFSAPDPEPEKPSQPFDIDLSLQTPGLKTEPDDQETPDFGQKTFQAPLFTDEPPAEEGEDDASPPDFLPLQADVMTNTNNPPLDSASSLDLDLRQQPAAGENENDSSIQKPKLNHPEKDDPTETRKE